MPTIFFKNIPNQALAFAIGTVAIGLVLRIWHFVGARSLWIDEAMIGKNIIDRSFAQLFQSLDYGQIAPIGWLILEKVAYNMIGGLEYSLRLAPFIFGIAALGVFSWLTLRCFKGILAPIVIFLFAINPRLIFYSAEVKQYGADVFFSSLLTLIAFYFLARERV
ncbi:MAG: hypothetical protein FVQ81_18715, partial [Candidatus Glassbacteria bacterium]|nr:hypothetical protein [Candidatus Glassbacteria bacterium]